MAVMEIFIVSIVERLRFFPVILVGLELLESCSVKRLAWSCGDEVAAFYTCTFGWQFRKIHSFGIQLKSQVISPPDAQHESEHK